MTIGKNIVGQGSIQGNKSSARESEVLPAEKIQEKEWAHKGFEVRLKIILIQLFSVKYLSK